MANEKHIFSFCVSAEQNCNNFVEIMEANLQELNLPLRKRIISCAIELIQNNLIHNSGEKIEVGLSENKDFYILQTERQVDYDTACELEAKIAEINATDIELLKQRYKQNLANTSESTGTGNGLLQCKIKSRSNITIQLVENKLFINLSFEK